MGRKIVFLKKITAILLTIILTASVLCGCKSVVLVNDVSPDDALSNETFQQSVLPSETDDLQETDAITEKTAVPSPETSDIADMTPSETASPTVVSTEKPAPTVTVNPTPSATSKPVPTATSAPTAKSTATKKPVATATPAPTPVVEPEKSSRADYMHISFDDVIVCFEKLASENYSSLWDEPFFRWLKVLHETYGVKFSLYTYNDVLEKVDGKYASQFNAANDWLKIGFHSNVKGRILYSGTYSDGLSYWNEFVEHVVRITGSCDSVDRIPRLEGFAGSVEMLKGMRDAEYGALGFLASDDSRLSYYLSRKVADCLYTEDYIIDRSNNLIFISTDFRAEWYETGYTNTYRYRKPSESTVYKELEKRENSDVYEPTWKSLIFFTHEYRVYDGENIRAKGASFVEDMCKFAVKYNLRCDYPQNRVYPNTKNDYLFDE